jgi:hypothetical protein
MGIVEECLRMQERERQLARLSNAAAVDRLINDPTWRNAASPFSQLQQGLASRIEQRNPFDALSAAIRAAAPYNPTEDAHRGIVARMREAEQMNDAQRGIAAAMRDIDPMGPLRLALQEAQRDQERLGGTRIVDRFRQPFADFDRQLFGLESRLDPSSAAAAQLSAMRGVLSAVEPMFDVADDEQDAPDDDMSEQDAAAAAAGYQRVTDILERTFEPQDEVLDIETFKAGVGEIVAEIRNLKKGRVRREVIKVFLQVLVGLIVTFLSSDRQAPAKHEARKPNVELVALAAPKTHSIIANVLRVHPVKDHQSPVIARLKKGQRVTLVEEAQDWAKIEWPDVADGGPQTGWVALVYLKPEGP